MNFLIKKEKLKIIIPLFFIFFLIIFLMNMSKAQNKEVVVIDNSELSDELILYIPGIGVKPEDLSSVVSLFRDKGKFLRVFNFETLLEGEKTNSQDVFDEINSIIPEGKKIDYLIGYSLGGGVVFDYVKNYSENVDNLILIDPYIVKSDNYLGNWIGDMVRIPD